ncbi:hypothetical protein XENOCAPTIV_008363 [Xenoophorus captivus]|uniref:Uncharacterized protein n=1 Tax=Xenoophorus captivus TaxID=1517983 RepID=A0ABV0RT68_9TELE
MLKESRIALEVERAATRDRLEAQKKRDIELLKAESEEELEAMKKRLEREMEEKLNTLKQEVVEHDAEMHFIVNFILGSAYCIRYRRTDSASRHHMVSSWRNSACSSMDRSKRLSWLIRVRQYVSSHGASIQKTKQFLERERSRLLERQAALQAAQTSTAKDPGLRGPTEERMKTLQQVQGGA